MREVLYLKNTDCVLFDINANVATVTLNRPEKANAFNGEMWTSLEKIAALIKLNSKIKAVIITGSGKAFCSGLDINQASSEGISLGENTYRPGFETLSYLSDVFTLYEQLPVPIIAAINGGCIGLGMELALACDIRLASTNAIFSIPEVLFGLVPDCGGTQRLPRAVGPAMAKELIFTGRRVDAEEALKIRLVNHIYPPANLAGEAIKLAEGIAAHPADAVQASKRCLNMAMNSSLQAGLQYETAAAESVLGEKVKTMIRNDSSES